MMADITRPIRAASIASQPLPLDQIVCGDNVAVMSGFPDASINLVVTSPPYDNLRVYGGHSWDFEGVAQQLWRVIKPGGVVVWVVADATVNGSETGTSFRQALQFMEIGFRLNDTMIYEKTCVFQATKDVPRYYQTHEFMFVMTKGKPKTTHLLKDVPNVQAGGKAMVCRGSSGYSERTNVGGEWTIAEYRKRGTVWRYDAHGRSAADDSFAFNHPAIFPEALARDHILSWSNEVDIVLDPFNGSGTTTKMARLMGRRFIGIDVNEGYCEIARKRIAQKLLDFGDAG